MSEADQPFVTKNEDDSRDIGLLGEENWKEGNKTCVSFVRDQIRERSNTRGAT